MYPLSEHRPDCRIFFKRLVTPDPEVTKTIPLGSSHMGYIQDAFHNYYPKSFRKSLLDRYKEIYQTETNDIQKAIEDGTKSIKALEKSIKNYNDQLVNLPFDSPQKPIIKQMLTKAEDQLLFQRITLETNQKAYSTVRPLYEPYLLELVIGLVSVNTTILRDGIGTANITIKLPLEENGFVENILYGIQNTEMFYTGQMESTVKPMSTNPQIINKISSRELSIFKLVRDSDDNVLYTDRRECVFLPDDMVQIYFTKRYITGKSTVDIPVFPRDYIPGFTGFIVNTSVEFSAGQSPNYTIKINCEDISHPLRISRANIDPAADPQYRAQGLSLSPWVTKVQAYGDEEATGPRIIKSLIVGKVGSWGGVSQIETADDVHYDGTTGQYTFLRGVKTISMPWEFDRIPFNSYDDLINKSWKPYVAAFKTSWRLWESEYKFRWEICRDIADVMEFEMYADNFGALNYHPPFYNLNPANIKYFIEDKDIISEQYNFSETGVVTAVEITSQAQLGIPPNIVKMLSAFATADDEWVQRYGMRFRQKNIPVLSGTDRAFQTSNQELLRETRYLFARAWLNRRNLEAQSATVEIPGTPEYFLCNSVTFIGNYGEFVANLALSSVASTVSGTSDLAHIESATVEQPQWMKGKELAKTMVNNLKVYYISGISHRYTHGGSFTTSLRLTHGRLWGKHFSVGYSFSQDDNDKLLQDFKQLECNRMADDIEMLHQTADMYRKSIANNKLMLQSDIFNAPVKEHAYYVMDSIAVPKPVNKKTFLFKGFKGGAGEGGVGAGWSSGAGGSW